MLNVGLFILPYTQQRCWQEQPVPGMEEQLEEAGKEVGTRSQDLQPGDVVSQCPQLRPTTWRMSDKAHSLWVKAYKVMLTIGRFSSHYLLLVLVLVA